MNKLQVTLLLWTLTSCLACSSPEKQKRDHIERGLAYQKAAQWEPALLELKSAIQIDPRDVQARQYLAQTYRAIGDASSLRAARFHLELTIDGGLNDPTARLDLAELHLLFAEPRKALEQAQECLQADPGNTRALLLRGKAQLAMGELEDASADLKRAALLLPENAEVCALLAELWVLSGDLPAAQAQVDRALQLDPKASNAHSLQGDVHVLNKRHAEAEMSYARVLELSPSDSNAYIKLANFHVGRLEWEKAEAVYHRFVAAKANEPGPLVALAKLHRQRGDDKQAIEVLRKAQALAPNSEVVHDQLLAAKLRSDDALALKGELAKLNQENGGNDLVVSYYQAQLELRERHYEEGIRLLRLLVSKDPKSGPAQLALAKALLALGEKADATSVLKTATGIASVATQASALLSEIYLANDDLNAATTESRRNYENNRRSQVAVMAYGNALLRSGELGKARKVYEQAVLDRPDDAALHLQLGIVAHAQEQSDVALVQLEKALLLAPEFSGALQEIVGIYLERGKVADARERVLKQLNLAPRVPAYHELLGKIEQRQGRLEPALHAFRAAIELSDGVTDSHRHVAMIHVERRQAAVEKRRLQTQLEHAPGDVDAHAVLALLAHLEGYHETAREHYEAALKLSPRSGLLANNLASLLTDDPQQLERALGLSKLAYQAMPGDAHVLDTLGWLYYKKSDHERARTLLSTAARRAPNDSEIQYHYGIVLAQNAEKERSRKILSRVAKSDPAFAREVGLQATLNTL